MSKGIRATDYWRFRGQTLLSQELRRARIGRAQKIRRCTAYFARFLSLVVLVVTLWHLGETSRTLAKDGGSGGGVLRWIELSAWLTVICGWPLTVLFHRVGWFLVLRSYARALQTPTIISPSQVPSSELQAILDTYTATILPLSSPFDPSRAAPLAQLDSEHLPEMPDGATHYVYASDSAWSHDPEHHRQASAGASSGSRVSRALGGALGSAGVWLGAQVWRGVRWLMGAGNNDGEHGRYEEGGKENKADGPATADNGPKRDSDSSTSPFLAISTSAGDDYEVLDDTPPPPPPPKDAFTLERSRGPTIYVRMSDGRLERLDE
ncbi:hypothetical protein JCM10295v2_006339 [Rhodotorula toruloides]